MGNERDRLWCYGEINLLTVGSCQDTVEPNRRWLAWKRPTESDSDYYSWAEIISVGLAVPGDGMPDGWEVHYGLDPRNASDAILDSDSDGWDLDRDGYISRHLCGYISWENHSVIMKNIWLLDEGFVTPGLGSIDLSEDQNSFITYDQLITKIS